MEGVLKMANYWILTAIDTICVVIVILMMIKEQDLIRLEDRLIDILKQKLKKKGS